VDPVLEANFDETASLLTPARDKRRRVVRFLHHVDQGFAPKSLDQKKREQKTPKLDLKKKNLIESLFIRSYNIQPSKLLQLYETMLVLTAAKQRITLAFNQTFVKSALLEVLTY
jgi:hypothetical protein